MHLKKPFLFYLLLVLALFATTPTSFAITLPNDTFYLYNYGVRAKNTSIRVSEGPSQIDCKLGICGIGPNRVNYEFKEYKDDDLIKTHYLNVDSHIGNANDTGRKAFEYGHMCCDRIFLYDLALGTLVMVSPYFRIIYINPQILGIIIILFILMLFLFYKLAKRVFLLKHKFK